MTMLEGAVKPGLGAATGVIRAIFPVCKEDFPEIAECHEGTINIELTKPLIDFPVARISPRFGIPIGPGKTYPECFAFTRIRLRIADQDVKAWIYWSFSSPHRDNRKMIEVIAPRLQVVRPGVSCEIEILWPEQ